MRFEIKAKRPKNFVVSQITFYFAPNGQKNWDWSKHKNFAKLNNLCCSFSFPVLSESEFIVRNSVSNIGKLSTICRES